MGRDKALLVIDGLAMARRVHDALSVAGADTISGIGGDHAGLAAAGVVTVADRWPGAGPLGAVAQSLGDIGDAPSIAILSCDLLVPSAAAIAHLVHRRTAIDADVAVPIVGGRAQWTHAVWARRVLGIVSDIFHAGERSLVGATIGLDVHRVTDLPAGVTDDADRPEDLPETAPAFVATTERSASSRRRNR